MNFVYKKSFLKRFDSYGAKEQRLIMAAEEAIRIYYQSRRALYGLRIKKLYDNGVEKTYEARASDKIRILWVETKGEVSFAFVGSHDEVHRFIKGFA